MCEPGIWCHVGARLLREMEPELGDLIRAQVTRGLCHPPTYVVGLTRCYVWRDHSAAGRGKLGNLEDVAQWRRRQKFRRAKGSGPRRRRWFLPTPMEFVLSSTLATVAVAAWLQWSSAERTVATVAASTAVGDIVGWARMALWPEGGARTVELDWIADSRVRHEW